MIYGIDCSNHMSVATQRFSGIGIPVIHREITTRYIQSNFVNLPEYIADGPKVNGNWIDLPRLHQFLPLPGIPESHPQNSMGCRSGFAVPTS